MNKALEFNSIGKHSYLPDLGKIAVYVAGKTVWDQSSIKRERQLFPLPQWEIR